MQAGKGQRKKATKQEEEKKAKEKCEAQESQKKVLFFPPKEVYLFATGGEVRGF